MISLSTQSSAGALDYYEKDDYYSRESGNGEWFGKLKAELNVEEFLQDDYSRILKENERFRTYDLKFNISKGITNKIKNNEKFKEIQQKAIERVNRQIQKDCHIKIQKGILKEGTGRNEEYYNKFTSHNVAAKNFDKVELTLYENREKHNQLFQNEMVKGLNKSGIEAKKEDFKFASFTNSGRIGVDLCFSAPKSISLYANMSEQNYKIIQECQKRAVDRTLEFIEQNHIHTRSQVDGVSYRENTGNMIAAKFDHDVSRRQDPQFHTHCVIFNETRDKDGKIKTMDNKDLYLNKELYDRIYMNELARELQQKGLETELKDPAKGNWELKGIDGRLIDKYSQGKKEVDEQLEGKGLSRENASFWDKQIANKETRDKKKDIDIEVKREEWREDFKKHGQEDLKKDFNPEITPEAKQEIIDKSVNKLENKAAAWTKEDYLIQALKEGSNGRLTLNEIENHMEQSGKIIDMGKLENKQDDRSYHFEKNYFSTENSIQLEESIYDRALAGKGQFQGIDKGIVENHINEFNRMNEGRGLNQGQRDSIKVMCSSNDRVCVIIGDAGTGKTYSLAEAKKIFETQGYKIEAVAPSNKAVGELRGAGFENASTIHNLLNRMEKEAGNKTQTEKGEIQNDWNFAGLKPGNQKEVWIMDEASMVDNKAMSKFLEAAEKKGAKVVLQGDPKQLQPVGPGKSFTNLIQEGKIDIARLTENMRQKNSPDNVRDSVNAAARGDIKTSLEKLHGNMVEIKDRSERLSTMAKDYAGLPEKERPASVITSVNKDRIELNNNIRAELKEKGELQNGNNFKTDFGKREFAPGDKIIFLKTDNLYDQKIAKNDVGYIKSIEGDKITAYHNESKKDVTFSMKNYSSIDHGYAKTTYKSQGESASKVWINQDSKQNNMNNKNDLYVKISRTKGDVRIYTDNKPRLDAVIESKMYKQVSREQFKISVKDFKERPQTFRDLPKDVQNEIIKGERHNLKADRCREQAQEIREHGGKEKKALKYEAKAERFSARAENNFEKAKKIIEKHHERKRVKVLMESKKITHQQIPEPPAFQKITDEYLRRFELEQDLEPIREVKINLEKELEIVRIPKEPEPESEKKDPEKEIEHIKPEVPEIKPEPEKKAPEYDGPSFGF